MEVPIFLKLRMLWNGPLRNLATQPVSWPVKIETALGELNPGTYGINRAKNVDIIFMIQHNSIFSLIFYNTRYLFSMESNHIRIRCVPQLPHQIKKGIFGEM
jgi:hypothetical protein